MTQEHTVDDIKIDVLSKEVSVGALTMLKGWFAHPVADKDTLAQIKVAQAAYAAYTRHEATMAHRDHLTASLADRLSENPSELEHYLKVAMPSAPITKAIPEKT